MQSARHLALSLAIACALAFTAWPLGSQELFWENPRPFVDGSGRFPTFFQIRSGLVAIWQESEGGGTTRDGSALEGRVWLSLARSQGGSWSFQRRFAGPFPFRGSEPSIYSAVGEGSRIAIAAAIGEGQIEVLISEDGGGNFSSLEKPAPAASAVAPRIFFSATGGYILFATQGTAATEIKASTLAYSTSPDGRQWEPFATFEDKLDKCFLPVVARMPGKSRDIVVFQSLVAPETPQGGQAAGGGNLPANQLFAKTSTDGGQTWSVAQRLTTFQEPAGEAKSGPEGFDNQRPSLGSAGGKLWLSWERKAIGAVPAIYIASLDSNGLVARADLDRVSAGSGICAAPAIIELGGQPAVTWFDNRKGSNRIWLGQKRGIDWAETDLSGNLGESFFGTMALLGGQAYALWETVSGDRDRIFVLEPDTRASPPTLSALDFTPGQKTRKQMATIGIELPLDSSGIAGYAYSWSKDPLAEPPRRLMALPSQRTLAESTNADGSWYFAAAATDNAGNWSDPVRIRFDRDTTAPPPPVLIPFDLDDNGYLASNSFGLSWIIPEGKDGEPVEDVAGYTWELRYIGALESPPPSGTAPQTAARGGAGQAMPGLSAFESALVNREGLPIPPPAILGRKAEISYRNVDNGYYVFSVAAIDGTGNIGGVSSIFLRMNKYVPYTSIVLATANRDELGRSTIRILGRGFRADGIIERIVLDRDGSEPWDLDKALKDGGFRVLSDREIDGLSFEDLPAGTYRIGLLHSSRGWYWTGPVLTIDASGTIKYGGLAPPYRPSWKFTSGRGHPFSIYDAMVVLAALFSALGTVLLARQAVSVARDAQKVRLEVLALISGGSMPTAEKAEEVRRLRRSGAGLRVKVTLTIAGLVMFIVFLVALPLGLYMTGTESASLANGLRQRAYVLLESVAQGGRSYLPNAQDQLTELGSLPNQAQAMEDAIYITLTGYGASGLSTVPEVVYATNDPDIKSKIDTPTWEQGTSVLTDGLSPGLASMIEAINSRAVTEIGDIATEIAKLNAEGASLAGDSSQKAKARLDEISSISSNYEKAISEKLFALSNESLGVSPAFNPSFAARTSGRYLFYKPILYRQGQGQIYYRGLVRLEVSTEKITQAVRDAIGNLIRITLLVAAIALLLGVVGAFALSSVIVVPIKQLEAAVKRIRDTEDKEELSTLRIDVKTRDEISTLAVTIKEMSDGLVNAAKASKELIVGKGIQKMFIPLDPAPGSTSKLSTGRRDEKNFEVFGYYEGAKGVSGDYWDFERINSRYYYFIKCDISGKGVSAALIMVQVATMVINHFNGWKTAMPAKIDLTGLTYKINDFLEERHFKGRFAAFTLGVWDADEGTAYLCEAGDRKLHVWNAQQGVLVEETLPDSPAAGPFPSSFFKKEQSYVQVTRKLQHNDVLMLYTDGIDEAKRRFRDAEFSVITCDHVADPYPFLAGVLAEKLKLVQAAADAAPSAVDLPTTEAFLRIFMSTIADRLAVKSTETVIKAVIDSVAEKAADILFEELHHAHGAPAKRMAADAAIAHFATFLGHHGSRALKKAIEATMPEFDRHVEGAFITKPGRDFLGTGLGETCQSTVTALSEKLAGLAAARIEKSNPGKAREQITRALTEPVSKVAEPFLKPTADRLSSRLATYLGSDSPTKFRAVPAKAHLKRIVEDRLEEAAAALSASLSTWASSSIGTALSGLAAAGKKWMEFVEDFVNSSVPSHLNHKIGEDNEEFGYERITAILEAVDRKTRYRLVKNHNPLPDEVLSFDFSNCDGSLEEKVLSLIAVEKVFRMYPDPRATDADVVPVDEKVDSFLEKHFDQYRLFCSDKRPFFDPQKENPGYLLYGGIREDDQYDDLTILAIRKK